MFIKIIGNLLCIKSLNFQEYSNIKRQWRRRRKGDRSDRFPGASEILQYPSPHKVTNRSSVSVPGPALPPPPNQLCQGHLRLSTTEHHHVLHGWMHTSLCIINWWTDRVRWLTNASTIYRHVSCVEGQWDEKVVNTKLHLRCLTQTIPMICQLWRRLWKVGFQHSLWGIRMKRCYHLLGTTSSDSKWSSHS